MSGKFTVNIKRGEGYAVLETGSYLNQTAGEELFGKFSQLLDEGYTDFIIDMSRTKIVNSIGISILIEMIEKLRERDGRLLFCNLSNVISKTFRIMGLTQYAQIHPDEERAISALKGDR
jgi:anti-anti-sigma factor